MENIVQWERTNASKLFCNDNDVFLLLTAYILQYSVESLVLMGAFASNRSMVDINKTAMRNAEIVPSLIPAHTLQVVVRTQM